MSSAANSSALQIAERSFSSRFFLGTGKFSSNVLMLKAINASQTQLVTMALRRIELDNPQDDFLSSLAHSNAFFLPNTSGARNAEEAIRLARMARTATQNNWVKLEVTPEPKYLLPDPVETLKATAALVKEGFVVLPYINCDPILAKQLEVAGAATVMPLASPIGSNQGINNINQLKIIIEMASVPVIVDAGIGAPSHAAAAMELGADAVLVNTAVAVSKDPEKIAAAFSLAIQAGRMAFLATLPPPRLSASPSAPLTGTLH